MKISLQRVTYSARMSEETSCFAADLYIDGVKVGQVRNDGRGGCHHLMPWSVQDRLAAHAKTLSPITVMDGEKVSITYQPTWESLIDWALERHLQAKSYRALIKKKFVFQSQDGRLHTFEYPNKRPIAPVVALGEAQVLAQICPGRFTRCLNCMPEEDGLHLYLKALGLPEAMAAG